MAIYKSLKNLHIQSLNIEVAEQGQVELGKSFADEINKELKLTFPDVDAILVLIKDDAAEEVDEKIDEENIENTDEKTDDADTEKVETAEPKKTRTRTKKAE